MLPFSHATRNLLRDPGRLIQTVLGSGLVVFLILLASSFNAGMQSVLAGTGSPENVILLGAGSEESVERSEISPQTVSLALGGIRGISSRLGTPAASGEVHYMGLVGLPDHGEAQALLRGVTPAALEVHRKVQVLEGVFPSSGEVMVGVLAHHALGVPASALSVGREIHFENQTFKVAGIFASPGTVMESEVWMNQGDLMTATKRDTLSCVVLRLDSLENFKDADLFSRQRLDLELVAMRESDYYARLAIFYAPLRAIAWLTAALIGAGAVFGGLNLLYAAFSSRIREFATLQAIGFRRTAILFSLIQESLIVSLLGTLLASGVAVFLFSGISVPFSIGTFALELRPAQIFAGLATGVLLGVLGALPPAFHCLNTPLSSAFRAA